MTPVSGNLFIVATPIGNLEDITQRALRILREVDLIACEDTRHTRKLLNHFAITTATISYHEHNEQERAAKLCEVLESGKNVALVSDAGTPLVSDPGFRVVQAAVDRGISVVPIPGASAVITALSVSGLPTDQFLFAGFLPARTGARRAKLDELRTVAGSLVFYEAPHRIKATLQDAREVLGNREAFVARELTKLHEEFARGTLSELVEKFLQNETPRGEMVLIISGQAAELPSPSTINPNIRLGERIEQLEGEGMDQKSALKQAAKELGMKRADAYRMMVNQKNRRSK
ncbi:MAG TPA: 16S rRNA (cytidine(1402)-2'-O)-methyltransferase [Pyrinomonadaceae bacterium]|jgi:16S rRNA (cytidine1402-2'-O)-methyltransferase|nr:16S rRNA (cytidine(1402)-2'-O)-methyltransferase [Pyrinomonadaceae bacterium]